MAGSLATGAGSGWQMDGEETVTTGALLGSVPDALRSLLKGLLLPSLQLLGPHQLPERASGKHCLRVKFPSSNSLCQTTLQPPAHSDRAPLPLQGGRETWERPGLQQERRVSP